MKPFTLNHAKLTLSNNRHNLFHWLTVVAIKVFRALIIIPLSFYLTAIGFITSANQIRGFLPISIFPKMYFWTRELPYFDLIEDFITKRISPSPWIAITVGIPLILIGISALGITFFNLYYAIFSKTYNRTHCPFCQTGMVIENN